MTEDATTPPHPPRPTETDRPADADHPAETGRPADADRPARRERLLRAVRERLERVGGPEGNAHLHTPEALRETDGLRWHLIGPLPGGTGHGLDLEVAYTLGVMCLVRADDRPEAASAWTDGRWGLTLLAPFHCHLPGRPDVLPPFLRAAIDQILGPGGGRPEDPQEIVRTHAAALVDVAMLALELGNALSYPEAFPVAAQLVREAIPYLPAHGPERAVACCNLGYALLLTALHGQPGPEVIAEAVAVLRTAFADTPRDHPNRARCAGGLGLALMAQAGEARSRALMGEAVGMLRTATRTATELDGNVAQMHSDLGYALTAFALSAEDGDEVGPEVREEAVAALRRSLDLTPERETAMLRDRLGRLTDALLIGTPDDDGPRAAEQAAEAVEVLRRLLELTPEGRPERADVVLRLAANLVTAGRPREATELLAGSGTAFAGDRERQRAAEAVLFQAAIAQNEARVASRLTPEQRAAEKGIDDLLRPLLEGDTAGHPLGAVLDLLGMGPDGGGGRGQELMEFGRLVMGYPDRVSLSEVVTKALELQARRIARLPEDERADAVTAFLSGDASPNDRPAQALPVDTGDLDELAEVHERLLSALPPGSQAFRMLGMSRQSLRLQRIGLMSQNQPDGSEEQAAIMREALPLMRELFDELPVQMEALGITPELLGGHTALAFAQESPFERLESVESGLREARRRLNELAPGTREYDRTRSVLALFLFIRFCVWSEEADFEEARDLARELTSDVAEPGMRVAVLVSQWTSAAGARVRNAGLLDAPAPADGRSPSLITRLASEGAARALDDRDPVEALETLEDGRAHLLSTALNTRREMEFLHGADAELHGRVRAALDRVRELRGAAEPGRWPEPEEVEAQRRASEEAARVVTELKERPGFRRFLTPLPLALDDLLPAASEGPVVSVNVSPRRCDALVLCADGLRLVPLPRLCASDLAAQAESFRLAVRVLTAGPRDPLFEDARGVFTGTLAWLWDVLAGPVLDTLGFAGPPAPGEPWPRLWWSPSGVLNAFPLHAAGQHGPDGPAGATVLDRVASSYTPTVRALLHSRARRRAAPGERSVLAVAMPETAGQAPLVRTVGEAGAAVAAGGGELLVGPEATAGAVRRAVLGASVVHFACHADGDPEDPAAGRLLLSDGDLLIRDIAELRLESAELAYLSACGTARGSASPALADEVIHLASVFQLAGYSQSVATLWEVGDSFAARAAGGFHRLLAPDLTRPGPLPAARALHRTVRALRAADPGRPWTWAALVHSGA